MTLSPPPSETRPASNTALNESGPVLREYVSPTCKLQISAKPSALEKWTRKPTLKNQRFLLSFEDPRLSEDQWVSLRGDRLKLAALTEAVTTYVQNFLGQSRTINPAELTETTATPIVASPQPSQGISLQPKGLLAHTLTLGTIASSTSDGSTSDGSTSDGSLSLTSTQLADLASVLDEHSTTTLDLPVLNRDTAWMRSPTAWGKIAALSLLSVGVTASVLNQFSPKQTPTQIASQASSSDQRLTPPQVPQPTQNPSVFVSPGSTFPGQQLPPIGSSSMPPIASESNPNSNPSTTIQGTSKPESGNKSDTPSNLPGKTSTKTVESTANPAAAATSKPSLSVNPVPVAARQPQSLDNVRSRKSTNSNEAADSEPQPPEPDLTAQLERIQSKIPTQWTPPEKFSEEITYIIEVAPSGVVKAITPEGKGLPAAQSILPTIGSTIAPPLPPVNGSYSLRVFFYPDGTVNVKNSVNQR